MPVSGTRRLMTGGATLGFDIKDPSLALYAPLWHPDMVANGGSIVNGNGTMDISPQNLAVGANTITVTAAGTLIVNIPEGGTVASGTMTVTGSPVTVSAGIATTITTTGAIGNITVTPSNIIRSKDKNNLSCAVTGATWGSQGRTFDATDDIIQITAPDFGGSQFDGGGTLIAVINPAGVGEGGVGRFLSRYGPGAATDGWSFSIESQSGNFVKFGLYHYWSTGDRYWRSVSAVVPLNVKSHLAVTYNSDAAGNLPILYMNGAVVAGEEVAGSEPSGTRDSDVLANFNIGNNDATTNTFDGVVKAVWAYRRLLTAGGIMNHYLTTGG